MPDRSSAPPPPDPSSRPAAASGWSVAWPRTALLVAVLACAVVVSLLWWRTDANLCVCEYCPDGYCTYATQIHALLRATSPAPVARFLDEAAAYLHAHSPLAPALIALLQLAGLRPVPAFMLLSIVATLLSWRSVRRTVERSWSVRPVLVLQLMIAFVANPIVIRSVARPVTDALGMLCVVWVLAALDRHLATRDRRSMAWLFVLQLVGLASRVSFIPMLGMPALAELAEPGPSPVRLRRALRAGVVLGALPALLFFGVLRVLGLEHVHDAWVWAHQPEFVAKAPVLDFGGSLMLAGGGYLVLGLLSRGGRPVTRAWRIHLVWVALYIAFLGTGRGALWPRYFLPVVPSVLIVATPALLALDRRSVRLAWGVVGLCALLGVHAVLRARHARESIPLLARTVSWPTEHARTGRTWTAGTRAGVTVTSSTEPASAALMVDGRSDTAWSTIDRQAAGTSITLDLGRPHRVRALRLATDGAATRADLVVDGSLDGETWRRLPVTFRSTDFFAERPWLELRLRGPRVRTLRVTATTARPVAWTIDELQVRVARDAARERRRAAP